MSSAPIEWVLNNAVLNVYHAGIAGTPQGVPWPGVWDGSLWTLIFEVLLYITVVFAGLAGLLKRRWPAVVVFALALVAAAVFSYPVHAVETIPQMVARFALVFAAGAVLHQFQDMVPARWSLVAVSAAIVIAASLFVPNYRTVAVLPLAYAVIVSGALLKNPRLRLPNDLSYGTYVYAWPMQQLAGHLRAGLLASGRVRDHCDDRHAAAGRTELVPSRETLDAPQVTSKAQETSRNSYRSGHRARCPRGGPGRLTTGPYSIGCYSVV